VFFSQFSHAKLDSIQEAWTGVSVPTLMSNNFVYEIDRLPLNGKAHGTEKFWSGDYWAFRKGSINSRWNERGHDGFNLKSPTREEASKMSIESLSRLSPTEKYDLFTGRYDYPLKKEVEGKADSSAAHWEGICHGWSPAAMNHNEPTPKLMTNPDGIVIPFGSSDIKALLSYYYAFTFKVADTHQMGRRCDRRLSPRGSQDCKQDLNAGAFHIVVANLIGLEGQGFIADFDRFKKVWNHPVHAYSSEVVRTKKVHNSSAPGTIKVLYVKTTLTYTDEAASTWETVIGTKGQKVKTKDFEYDLDIDGNGKIIGGEWQSRARPDFIWTTEKALIWVGQFDRLNELLND
jgi:hypothetical protein